MRSAMLRSRSQRVMLMVLCGLVAIPLIGFIGGVIVMSLWNWLAPALFGLHRIGFWQALGLLALCRILFGGLGRYGSSRSRSRWGWSDPWEGVSTEEREELRRRMRERIRQGVR